MFFEITILVSIELYLTDRVPYRYETIILLILKKYIRVPGVRGVFEM